MDLIVIIQQSHIVLQIKKSKYSQHDKPKLEGEDQQCQLLPAFQIFILIFAKTAEKVSSGLDFDTFAPVVVSLQKSLDAGRQ